MYEQFALIIVTRVIVYSVFGYVPTSSCSSASILLSPRHCSNDAASSASKPSSPALSATPRSTAASPSGASPLAGATRGAASEGATGGAGTSATAGAAAGAGAGSSHGASRLRSEARSDAGAAVPATGATDEGPMAHPISFTGSAGRSSEGALLARSNLSSAFERGASHGGARPPPLDVGRSASGAERWQSLPLGWPAVSAHATGLHATHDAAGSECFEPTRFESDGEGEVYLSADEEEGGPGSNQGAQGRLQAAAQAAAGVQRALRESAARAAQSAAQSAARAAQMLSSASGLVAAQMQWGFEPRVRPLLAVCYRVSRVALLRDF